MFIPTTIQVRNRKVSYGSASLSGTYINAPNGNYKVLEVVDLLVDGFDPLTVASKGLACARILTIKPGVLGVIEPMEIQTVG